MEIEKVTESRLFPELRAWMERTGMRQVELARVLNISEPSMTNYLAGTTAWPTEIALRLSLLTEVPVDRFVTKESARLLKLWGKRSTETPSNGDGNANVA